MAEIHVQRKRRAIWPSIIAAVAVVVLVWAAAEMFFDEDEYVNDTAQSVPQVPNAAPTSGVADAPPPAVAAFLAFADEADEAAAGPAHDYTATGIRRLSASLDAIVEQNNVAGQNVRERIEEFRRTAERIQANPDAKAHADRVREAFMSAASLMSTVQQDRWPNSDDMRNDLEQVRAAASAVDASRPLLEQTSAVREFFDRAAVVVRRMAGRT